MKVGGGCHQLTAQHKTVMMRVYTASLLVATMVPTCIALPPKFKGTRPLPPLVSTPTIFPQQYE